MGILGWFGVGKELAKPIEAISDLYTTDKAKLMAQAVETTSEAIKDGVDQKRDLAQLENNKIMASSGNFFSNAWQPLIGWTSGFCLALYYIPQLVVMDWIWCKHVLSSEHFHTFPIDPSDLLHLVYLLLGFGTYHIVKRLMR